MYCSIRAFNFLASKNKKNGEEEDELLIRAKRDLEGISDEASPE